MNNIKVKIIMFLISSSFVLAQGGSNYSILGIGDINYMGNSAYTAMAGTQIAFPTEFSINSRNPAMWSFVQNTRLQAGYKFNQNIVSDDNSVAWHNNGNITGFSGLFAIDSAYGTAASFGIVPYSQINYLTATETRINQMGMDLYGKTTYQGTGGLSQAYLGVASKFTDWFGAGVSAFANFGVVRSSRVTSFDDDYYSFNYQTQKSDYANGWGYKAGAFFSPIDNLIVGFSFEAQPGLGVASETNYKSPTLADTTVKFDSDIDVPNLIGLGVSYQIGKFIIGADYSVQDFTNFNFNYGANTEFTNSTMLSIGVNRIGNSSLNANFSDRVSYKFGAGYNQLYYKVLGNQVVEYLISTGAQMPFAGSMIVDVALVFGHRTANNSRLVSESFIRLGVDISMGETWFKPFIREY